MTKHKILALTLPKKPIFLSFACTNDLRCNTLKMGTGKKEATRKEKQGKTSDGMSNVKTKGENFYRSAKKAKTLSMFKDGKAQRNATGKVTKAASYQSRDKPKARVEPNRK